MLFDLFISRDEREYRELRERHERVRRTYEASIFGGGNPVLELTERGLLPAWDASGLKRDGPLFDRLIEATAELAAEIPFVMPKVPARRPSTIEMAEMRRQIEIIERLLTQDIDEFLGSWDRTMYGIVTSLLHGVPRHMLEVRGDAGFEVRLIDCLEDPAATIQAVLLFMQTAECRLHVFQDRLKANVYAASGISDPEKSTKQVKRPLDQRHMNPQELARAYLGGTPLLEVFETPLPFSIPASSRFEHMHVVGGSGHGKTQLLQHSILADLPRVAAGEASVVVIDSQGDMIDTILHLAAFDPASEYGLASRLVLIDPNDVEYPPCLNLFDLGLERLERYGAADREKIINGAIALYEYMFGALLGADLTQRQGVIFRYLARLMLVVPGATIHTMRLFMEEPEAARPYFADLEGSSRRFFETQFLSSHYDDTRKQILTRLWGVLSNPVLERMFSHKRNKVDAFDALNSGKVLLINTAKDLLKQEGCEILGRFFIAMITHAAQERAAIPSRDRTDTLVYIDEAHDYFDENVGNLLNQARKYRVGLTLAHQNLGQFDRSLLASVMSSTAIKLAGGVSAHDATALAKEMRCDPEFVQRRRKRDQFSEFACFVRHVTERPVALTVPFGVMEREPQIPPVAYEKLRELNRSRYCEGGEELEETPLAKPRSSDGGFELGEYEAL